MDTIISSAEIGARLKELRLRRGMTQEQLAVLVGVQYQQIQQYESGSSKMSTDRLQMVAGALDVPVSYFFDECEDERALSFDEKELLAGYRDLDIHAKEFILRSLKRGQK